MTFTEWVAMRQDARQWSEDELACAQLAWESACQITANTNRLALEAKQNRIEQLERDYQWLEHENWNLKNMEVKK